MELEAGNLGQAFEEQAVVGEPLGDPSAAATPEFHHPRLVGCGLSRSRPALGSPFRSWAINSLSEVQSITLARASWYNASRLVHRFGRRPPAEADAEYYAQVQLGERTGHRMTRCGYKRDASHS